MTETCKETSHTSDPCKYIANWIEIHCKYFASSIEIHCKYIANWIEIHCKYNTNMIRGKIPAPLTCQTADFEALLWLQVVIKMLHRVLHQPNPISLDNQIQIQIKIQIENLSNFDISAENLSETFPILTSDLQLCIYPLPQCDSWIKLQNIFHQICFLYDTTWC